MSPGSTRPSPPGATPASRCATATAPAMASACSVRPSRPSADTEKDRGVGGGDELTDQQQPRRRAMQEFRRGARVTAQQLELPADRVEPGRQCGLEVTAYLMLRRGRGKAPGRPPRRLPRPRPAPIAGRARDPFRLLVLARDLDARARSPIAQYDGRRRARRVPLGAARHRRVPGSGPRAHRWRHARSKWVRAGPTCPWRRSTSPSSRRISGCQRAAIHFERDDRRGFLEVGTRSLHVGARATPRRRGTPTPAPRSPGRGSHGRLRAPRRTAPSPPPSCPQPAGPPRRPECSET